MRTPEELLALGKIDPETEAAQEEMPFHFADIDHVNPTATIHQVRRVMAIFPPPPPDPLVTESQTTFVARDGHSLKLYAYSPVMTSMSATSSCVRKPLIVLYHWGGFCLGTPKTMAPLARTYAKTFNAVVVSPEYRLSPEHKFPTPLHDIWDALLHISHNAASFGADPTAGFVVGGHSAGASAALILAHMARDEGLNPPLTGVYAACGSCLLPANVPQQYKPYYLSRTQHECTHSQSLFNAEWKAVFDACTGRSASSLSPSDARLGDAFNWPTGHAGLPRIHFQVCGQDLLRDEVLLMEEVLREEGAETRLDLYAGQPHLFWTMYPYLAAAKKAMEDMVAGMEWLLRKEGDGP